MPIEYYLAPVELITRGAREFTGSRVQRHTDETSRISNMQPAPTVKAWCATALDAPQAIHDAIANDGAIQRIPTNVLSRTWGELSAGVQNAILTVLANRRIPTGWITPATTVRQIIAYILRCLDLTVRMPTFPEADLTQTFGTLPAQARTAIRAFMNSNGIANGDIGVNTALSVVVLRLIEQFNFPPFQFLDEVFTGQIVAAEQGALDRMVSGVLEFLGL